jgi:hypothetical protein
MDDDSDINDQDVRYVWSSNGGCGICDAMAGEYDEEPGRPHENCQCEIASVVKREHACDKDDIEINLVNWYFSSGGSHVTVEFDVTCNDGSIESFSIELDLHVHEPDVFLTDAISQIELPKGCSDCDAPLVV